MFKCLSAPNVLTLYPYIAIEGNIGAGKTVLAQKLASEFDAELILEEFSDNPFLEKFYRTPEEYSFQTEVAFLVSRFKQLQQRMASVNIFKPRLIADYFFQKSLVFASINLKADELNLFHQLYSIFSRQLRHPDLILYLHRNVGYLRNHIQNRGRIYELKLSDDYLLQIEQNYRQFFRQSPDLRIVFVELQGADFIDNRKTFKELLKIVSVNWNKGLSYVEL